MIKCLGGICMVERVDYYSDDEYEQALAWEEEWYKEEQAQADYEQEYAQWCAFQEYLLNSEENK